MRARRFELCGYWLVLNFAPERQGERTRAARFAGEDARRPAARSAGGSRSNDEPRQHLVRDTRGARLLRRVRPHRAASAGVALRDTRTGRFRDDHAPHVVRAPRDETRFDARPRSSGARASRPRRRASRRGRIASRRGGTAAAARRVCGDRPPRTSEALRQRDLWIVTVRIPTATPRPPRSAAFRGRLPSSTRLLRISSSWPRRRHGGVPHGISTS